MINVIEKVTTIILARSPIPKITRDNGINAGEGIVLKKSMSISKYPLIFTKYPNIKPIGIPIIEAIENEVNVLHKE